MTPSKSAAAFRALHQQATPLRLPNAWDAGSALQIAQLGAKAIATTSAGVAWSLGYRDGNTLPISEYAARTASIARVVEVPPRRPPSCLPRWRWHWRACAPRAAVLPHPRP